MRVADAEHRAPENLPAEGVRMDDRADVGDGEVVEDVELAGLDVDLDFGEPGDEGMRGWPSRGYVSRATPISPCPASAAADAFVNGVDVLRHFVAVVLAAELDRLLRRLRQRHAAPPPAEDAFVGDLVVLRPAAERLRRDLLQLLLRVGGRRMRRARHARGWSGCRRDTSTAGSSPCGPRSRSTFSHGMPSISADTRWQSLIDSVPRLPIPD